MPATPAFGETVAQWRLTMRTEVKKASALPTAMFDACDPMLETRLVETAESMLACLQEPAPSVAEQPTGEQRIEQVSSAELRLLPRLMQRVDAGPLSLDDGLQAEYFAVLIDTWSQPEGRSRATAARRLTRDFAPGTPDALDDAAAELWQCTQAALAGDADADARLHDVCKRIAAGAIVQQAQRPDGAPA